MLFEVMFMWLGQGQSYFIATSDRQEPRNFHLDKLDDGGFMNLGGCCESLWQKTFVNICVEILQ
jgi:hypothetical protein